MRKTSFSEIYEREFTGPIRSEVECWDPDTIYYEQSGDYIQLVFFICPCGCGGATVLPTYMNPDTKEGKEPMWLVEKKDDKISLTPSIWRKQPNSCNAHYFLKNNEVQWC